MTPLASSAPTNLLGHPLTAEEAAVRNRVAKVPGLWLSPRLPGSWSHP